MEENLRIGRIAVLTRAGPDRRVFDVMSRPRSLFGQGRILVFEDEILVGTITSSDIARLLQLANLRQPSPEVRARPEARSAQGTPVGR